MNYGYQCRTDQCRMTGIRCQDCLERDAREEVERQARRLREQAEAERKEAERKEAERKEPEEHYSSVELSKHYEKYGVGQIGVLKSLLVNNCKDYVKIGALLRIATAVEKMQKDIALLVRPLKKRKRKQDRRGW